MPPLCTKSAAPLDEAVFELSTQCANVVLVAGRLVLSPTATAPPQAAEFEAIAQFIAVNVDASTAPTAPPQLAEFAPSMQLAVVMVESSHA